MKNLTEMSNEELWELFPIVLCGHKEEWKQMYENEKKLHSSKYQSSELLQKYLDPAHRQHGCERAFG